MWKRVRVSGEVLEGPHVELDGWMEEGQGCGKEGTRGTVCVFHGCLEEDE